MKKYLLYFLLIKFMFLLTSINGFDRINNEFHRLRESVGWSQQGASTEEGAVGGIEEGVELMNISDYSSKACNDFYSYVCNLKDENNWTLQSMLKYAKAREMDSADKTFIDLLEEADNGSRYDKLSMEKAWYKACMDRKVSRQQGFIIMKEIVNENGGLLNVDESLVERPKWPNVASSYARRFGESAFFKFSLNEQKIILIDTPSQWKLLELRSFDIDLTIDQLFQEFSNYTREDAVRIKERLNRFIKRMIVISAVGHYQKVILTIKELDENYRFINWLSFFRDSGMDLNNMDQVEINYLYLTSLERTLVTAENNVVVNYIHWLYVTADGISIYWDTHQNAFNNGLLSTLCSQHMPIKEGIGSILKKQYLADRKILIKEVFENVRDVFIREIHKSWLVNNFTNETLEKVENVQLSITNTQLNFIPNQEVSYMFDLNLCSLENLMHFNKAQMEYLLTVFKENQPKLEFDLISRRKRDITFRLESDYDINEIKISAAEIITPFFDISKPIAWNYGYVATTISYQFTQLIDKIIYKLDRTHPIRKKYYRKGFCFYMSYFTRHLTNPRRIIWNCIHNSLALKMSYKALNNALKQKTIGENETLPTFKHLKGRQLFFTSFTAGNCGGAEKKEVINEAMRHSKGFAQAFKCAPKTFMNPDEKCDFLKSKCKTKRLKTYLQHN